MSVRKIQPRSASIPATTPYALPTTTFAAVSLALIVHIGLPIGRAKAEEITRTTTPAPVAAPSSAPARSAMDRFLDRLTIVEAGGRETAKNPRSSALGPFQFITSTFLDVARRHFLPETLGMQPQKVLALRTDRAFSRRAAEAYTLDSAAILSAHDIVSTPANLRLAYLLGPGSAVRVLKAQPAAPVLTLLGGNVVRANPFMKGMTAGDLARWSERNMAGRAAPDQSPVIAAGGATVLTSEAYEHVSLEISAPAPRARSAARGTPIATSPRRGPTVAAQPACRTTLASCRRWVALNSGVKRPIAAAKQVRKVVAKRTGPPRNRIVHASGRGGAA